MINVMRKNGRRPVCVVRVTLAIFNSMMNEGLIRRKIRANSEGDGF